MSVRGGRASVTVRQPWITSASLVVATIQRDRADAYVRGVLVGEGSFRILLNRRVAHATKAGYLVFEQVAPFPD